MACRGVLLVLSCILGLWGQVGCEQNNDYENYSLLRIFPTNDEQIESVRAFEDPENAVEIFKRSRGHNDSLDILVPPSRMSFVQRYAQDNNLDIEVKQTNYGRMFEPETRSGRRKILRGFHVYEYNSYSAILEHLEAVARRHPNLVTLESLGESYQGRRMVLTKISANPNAGNPIIFVDAGIHAREWVAPSMALYIIHRLTSDQETRTIDLNGVDWYILPVVNPDGYEFTRSNKANRMWRKTRSKNTDSCFGVDGNRNYGYKWGVSGVSTNPCDRETFGGTKPFSEPETQNVRNIMMKYAQRIKLYVSIHSYGQYLVYPWGYTGNFLPKQWKQLDRLARKVSDAVQRAGGKPFRVMSAGQWYPAAGGSDDFAFGAVGIPYSYTMELTDGYEFIFPEKLLHVVLPQFYEGFKVFGAQISTEFQERRKRTADCEND